MARCRFGQICCLGLVLLIPLQSRALSQSDVAIATDKVLVLSADDLYSGLEATRVVLVPDGLAVDGRSQTEPPTPAQITTDVIDLGGSKILSNPLDVTRVNVAVQSNAESSGEITVQVRSGSSYFQHDGTWSEWSEGELDSSIGRYIQLRLRMPTQREAFRLKRATVEYSCKAKDTFAGTMTLVQQDVQKIIRGTIPFGYQRPGHPDLVWLKETFELDRFAAGPLSEFEKVNALCTWVSSRKNDRHSGWNTESFYPWSVRALLDPKDDATIYGHCASYCSVFLACCQSLGWQGRHFAVEGYRENCHEVAEIYINELGRWIYFDPSLATYYRDRSTGEPLDIVQMHDIYLASHFDQPGDTVPKREFDYDELSRRRASIDWRAFPGQPVTDDWVYGRKENWDWTKAQGILTTAWLQMTPRANFYDQPRPVFREFGNGPTGECRFPMWVDGRTPPRSPKTHKFVTRRRDFYWTLNQASIRLVRVGENVVRVELGNSQPFFAGYRIVANGVASWQSDPHFQWTIEPGSNLLVVNCEDSFGKQGVPSQVAVNLRDN